MAKRFSIGENRNVVVRKQGSELYMTIAADETDKLATFSC